MLGEVEPVKWRKGDGGGAGFPDSGATHHPAFILRRPYLFQSPDQLDPVRTPRRSRLLDRTWLGQSSQGGSVLNPGFSIF